MLESNGGHGIEIGNVVIRNTISGDLISNIGGNTVAATVSDSAAVNGAGPFANILY